MGTAKSHHLGTPHQADQPDSPKSSAETDYVSVLAHAVVDGVGETVSELCELSTAFGACEAFPQHSDELDWDQFDIGEVDKLQGSSRQRLAAVKEQVGRLVSPAAPKRILLRDKLAFLLGSCQLWATAYWLGWSPSTFYKYYSGQVAVLMAMRYAYYRHKRWHYYLLDFCYFANLLLLVHLWLLPKNLLLSKVTFAFNTGPLTWSTIAFRNSLVYHDLDKVTSVFLHLVPACVTWTLRWHPEDGRFGPAADAAEDEKLAWQQASLFQLVALPLLPYVLWAVGYYLKIFVVSAERIRQRGYITLFTYVTTTTKGVYAAIARRVPRQYRPQVYLFLHMCFCGTTFLLSWLAWYHFYLHTLLLGAMGAASLWHGATYYFDVFAKKYMAQLSQQPAGLEPSGSPAYAEKKIR